VGSSRASGGVTLKSCEEVDQMRGQRTLQSTLTETHVEIAEWNWMGRGRAGKAHQYGNKQCSP
jgi:hypothetical protein